jgi:hypothetical protein
VSSLSVCHQGAAKNEEEEQQTIGSSKTKKTEKKKGYIYGGLDLSRLSSLFSQQGRWYTTYQTERYTHAPCLTAGRLYTSLRVVIHIIYNDV